MEDEWGDDPWDGPMESVVKPIPAPRPKTTPIPGKGPSTKEGPSLTPKKNKEKDKSDKANLKKAKKEFEKAAEAYEKAKGTEDEAEAKERFNNALDALIEAAGFNTNVYNHNTIKWEGKNWIHVNVKAEVVLAAVKIATKLGARSMVISEGYRTKAEYYELYPEKKNDQKIWKSNYHCQQIALDVTFYKTETPVDASRIDSTTAAKTAREIFGKNFGGVSIYSNKTIVHIDLRQNPVNLIDYKSVSSF